MQRSPSHCEPYKICGKRFPIKFVRVLHVASLSKQALSDTGGCHSSTCAGEMPQRHFLSGNGRKFTAVISKMLDLCPRLVPPHRLWRSCAQHLHNFAIMIKKKEEWKPLQGNRQVHRACCWLPTEPACLCWLLQNLPLTSQWTSRILILLRRNHPRVTCRVKENFAGLFPFYMWTWPWAQTFLFCFNGAVQSTERWALHFSDNLKLNLNNQRKKLPCFYLAVGELWIILMFLQFNYQERPQLCQPHIHSCILILFSWNVFTHIPNYHKTPLNTFCWKHNFLLLKYIDVGCCRDSHCSVRRTEMWQIFVNNLLVPLIAITLYM